MKIARFAFSFSFVFNIVSLNVSERPMTRLLRFYLNLKKRTTTLTTRDKRLAPLPEVNAYRDLRENFAALTAPATTSIVPALDQQIHHLIVS